MKSPKSLLLLLCVALAYSIRPAMTVGDANLLLGEPISLSQHADELLVPKSQYAVGFSPKRFEPYWVSWVVTNKSMGDAERTNRFHIESNFDNVVTASPADYQKSGYDRGHLCPSADRTSTETDNFETFSMVNMVPQDKALNRGPWKALEEYSRDLVKAKHKLYIVAGAFGGTAKLNSKVVVPSYCWKVIVVLPKQTATPGEVTEDARTIAVLMPNDSNIKKRDWTEFVTSVDDIEKKTHYDLLAQLPDPVESALESRVDEEGDDDAY